MCALHAKECERTARGAASVGGAKTRRHPNRVSPRGVTFSLCGQSVSRRGVSASRQARSSSPVQATVTVSPAGTPQVVILSPIVKDSDLKRIRRAIETQQAKRRGTEAFSLISRFLDPHLFRKIGDYQEKEGLISDLADECLAQGFSNEGFVDAVLEREALSSTAFGNRVAIPHSMSAQANHSFLSVAVCEKGMSWDTQTVNLVLLLGIAESDRKAFRILFDSLIEVLSESINVTRLIKCRSYSDFVELLNEMIMGRG